jgi:ankyrin repeat protein
LGSLSETEAEPEAKAGAETGRNLYLIEDVAEAAGASLMKADAEAKEAAKAREAAEARVKAEAEAKAKAGAQAKAAAEARKEAEKKAKADATAAVKATKKAAKKAKADAKEAEKAAKKAAKKAKASKTEADAKVALEAAEATLAAKKAKADAKAAKKAAKKAKASLPYGTEAEANFARAKEAAEARAETPIPEGKHEEANGYCTCAKWQRGHCDDPGSKWSRQRSFCEDHTKQAYCDGPVPGGRGAKGMCTWIHNSTEQSFIESVEALAFDPSLSESMDALAFEQELLSERMDALFYDEDMDVNERFANGATVLHVAADKGDLDAVETVLRRADFTKVNSVDSAGRTALHMAAYSGHAPVVAAIVAHSNFTQVNLAENGGSTALHLAADLGHVDTVRALLAPAPLRGPPLPAGVKIYYLCVCGEQEGSGCVRPSAADLNAKDRAGRSALRLAAAHGHLRVAKLLLDRVDFTEVNARDSNGQTALHWAASNGHADVAAAILGHHNFSEVNAQDAFGWTALHRAAVNGHAQVSATILAHANFTEVNATVDTGQTAVELAAANGHTDVLVVLNTTSFTTEASCFSPTSASSHVMLASAPYFLDSARFERWEHFKDYGLPGTKHDPLNQAAIADGSCRLVDPPVALDGFAFWRSPKRVKKVLAALADAPPTDKPSYFVRATSELLLIPCSTPAPVLPSSNFTVAATAASMENWYHALCCPDADPSWHDVFDPAEEPQQMALTTGFLCIAACDAAGRELPASSMSPLSKAPAAARDAVCKLLPWGSGIDFGHATSKAALAKLAAPVLVKPCDCPA